MTDRYGQVRPSTIEVDAPRIQEMLKVRGPVYLQLCDGQGTKAGVTIGPQGQATEPFGTSEFGTKIRPAVEPDGFLVSVEKCGAYWFQPAGMAMPYYVWEKIFRDVYRGQDEAGDNNGWQYMTGALATLLTAMRSIDDLDKIQEEVDAWLEARGCPGLKWDEDLGEER